MHKRLSYILIPFILGIGSAAFAPADAQQALPLHKPIALDMKNILMLQAAQAVQKGEFKAALSIYDKIIAQNGDYIAAYIQRSVVRREIKDEAGSRADATMAIRLCEHRLRQQPNNAELYHQRGMGYRLLKDYPKAKENIQYAMRMPGANRNWEQDLRNIQIEEKFIGQ